MHALDFNLNRPVHMARRDAFFERAMDLLNAPTQDMDTDERLAYITRVHSLLKTAEHHGTFSVKPPQATSSERDFLHFLQFIAHNVQSAQSMLQHQSYFEGEEGFLHQFLGAMPPEAAMPATHYRRRADDIIQGLWQILRLSHQPYRNMRQAAVATLDANEIDRYQRAYASAIAELDAKK